MNEPITIEAEPQPQALVVRETTAAIAPPNLFGAADAVAVVQKASAVATALRDVLERQNLISVISGKKYPKCEAWTLLGTMLGVFPVLQWTRRIEGGWEARVEARTRDGAIVGAAEAECLKSERNWANRDDFALRSMAQTRATAKALRMPLGFVMTLGGYEATPAEEMTSDHPQKPENAPGRKTPHRDTPSPAPASSTPIATPKHLSRLVEALAAQRDLAERYFRAIDWLLPTETLEKLELRYVPVSKEQFDSLLGRLEGCANGEAAEPPYKPADISAAEKPKQKPIEVPRDPNPDPNSPDAPWRSFPVPWGKHAGVKLAELEKAVLFGFWLNFKVETEYNGKPKSEKAIAKDTLFRQMLEEAGKHYGFKPPEDTQ